MFAYSAEVGKGLWAERADESASLKPEWTRVGARYENDGIVPVIIKPSARDPVRPRFLPYGQRENAR